MTPTDTPPLRIRPCGPEDAEAIAAVILPIQQLEFSIPITRKAQPDLSNIKDFYQKGTGNFWVAEVDGRIVGTIGLLDIGNGDAALRKMFVDAAYRGRQFGTAVLLLEELLRWARTHKLKRIFLGTTEKFLAAHRFYEKHGFSRITKQNLPESFPIMTVDTVFYVREIHV